MERRYRRSRHLVCHWDEHGAVVVNYATGIQAQATDLMWQLLDTSRDWRSAADLCSSVADGLSTEVASELFQAMVAASFFEASDLPRPGGEASMDGWTGWNPAAGFFHTASRQCTWGEQAVFNDKLAAKSLDRPMPGYSRPAASERLRLPPSSSNHPIVSVLLDRRTWRQFGSDPVLLSVLAELLQMTSGVTHWLKVPGLGEVPLTTSPSGGARHPVETYVFARQVSGVAAGLYRYAADRHELDLVVPRSECPPLEDLFPQQRWFGEASFAVFFAAVFERTAWRYEFPLAYQAVLLEAGHMCQTFLLTATAFGLAPFSTIAVDLRTLERLLGLDGVSEAIIYAAGAGNRPPTDARVIVPPLEPPAETRPHQVTSAGEVD